MNRRILGAILSGGRSSRMRSPKALLPFGSARLIDHVAARLAPQVGGLLVNANDPTICLAGVPTVADRFSDFPGPLAGIHAALSEAAAIVPQPSHVATVPVDTPFFPEDLVAQLSAAAPDDDTAVLAASPDGLHPVVGLWPLSVLPELDAWLKNPPTLKVRAFLDRIPHCVVAFEPLASPFGDIDPFFNVNTPGELEKARSLLRLAG